MKARIEIEYTDTTQTEEEVKATLMALIADKIEKWMDGKTAIDIKFIKNGNEKFFYSNKPDRKNIN